MTVFLLFAFALSSFSKTEVKMHETLCVTTLTAATRAEEGQICRQENAEYVCAARRQVTVTQVCVMRSGQAGKTKNHHRSFCGLYSNKLQQFFEV